MPGLRNTIALDFHFNRSLLYWTDVVEDKIYRGKLSESGGMSTHKRTHTTTHPPTHANIIAIYLTTGLMYWLKRVMFCSSVLEQQ